MGYIEETGAAQYYRDARIGPIYEGTNGIQAIDLVTRKLPSHGGETVYGFIEGLKETASAVRAANEPAFGETGERLQAGIAALEETTGSLLKLLAENRNAALAGATPFLGCSGSRAAEPILQKARFRRCAARTCTEQVRRRRCWRRAISPKA